MNNTQKTYEVGHLMTSELGRHDTTLQLKVVTSSPLKAGDPVVFTPTNNLGLPTVSAATTAAAVDGFIVRDPYVEEFKNGDRCTVVRGSERIVLIGKNNITFGAKLEIINDSGTWKVTARNTGQPIGHSLNTGADGDKIQVQLLPNLTGER